MTASIPDALIQYLTTRDGQRADAVQRRIAELPVREQLLIREAAVMGFVLGSRSVPGGYRHEVPRDAEIMDAVVERCMADAEYYPMVAGSVRHLIRRTVGQHGPVTLEALADAVAAITALAVDEVEAEVAALVDDEWLVETPDGLREVTG